jgi:hypothetical protein
MIKTAFFDTECYWNYWLLKFKIGTYIYDFEVPLTDEQIVIIHAIFNNYTCISFNGINYDIPMVTAAITLRYNNEQLKKLSDQIIVEGVKHWQLNLPKWSPKDHIDLMEVAPGAGGLKQYAGRIHSKKIQDLPYDPGKLLTEEEKYNTKLYCGNDLEVLEDLYNSLIPQVEQRIALTARYGIDLRSKSDAQLAEAVLKHRCEQALKRKIYKSEVNYMLHIKYQAPEFISFITPQLQNVLNVVKESVFTLATNNTLELPEKLKNLEININGTEYKIGIGGLHSKEKQAVHISDDQYVLLDNDVASYYPTLILNSGKFPEALGVTFLNEYDTIKNERLLAKRTAKEVKLKIAKLKKELEALDVIKT